MSPFCAPYYKANTACQVFSKSDLIWKNIFLGWQQFLLLVSQGVGGDGRGKKCGLAYVEHGSRWSWTFEGATEPLCDTRAPSGGGDCGENEAFNRSRGFEASLDCRDDWASWAVLAAQASGGSFPLS